MRRSTAHAEQDSPRAVDLPIQFTPSRGELLAFQPPAVLPMTNGASVKSSSVLYFQRLKVGGERVGFVPDRDEPQASRGVPEDTVDDTTERK